MKRYKFAFLIPPLIFAGTSLLLAAPTKRKKGAAASLDSKAAASASTVAKTSSSQNQGPDVSSPWHVWRDSQGRSLEAAFCSVQDGICTVQSRDGQVYRLNLEMLTPSDRLFAAAYAIKVSNNKLKDDYVKKAAYKIDFHIGSTLVAKGLKFNPPVVEEVFLRRVYLDIIGRVPTATEAASYLSDTTANKRSKLIDALLNSPGHTMHMYDWLADMLRVKDELGRGAKAFLFQDWLKDQISADQPWDVMVRAMLTADGKLCENGATGFLLRDAQMPLDGVSNLLTTFLGANVACAQCHDHPLASWTQKDFYQMAAFFGASDGYDDEGFKKARQAIRTSGVNKKQATMVVGANIFRLVDQQKQTLKYPTDYKYDDAKPGAAVTPQLITWVPGENNSAPYRISVGNPTTLRDEFAKWMTHPDNPRFATAIANRIWKKVFGLGVQEPVTDLDDLNKSGNPELLSHITQVMKFARFDLRQFQRVLFNSQTYQRSASLPPDLEKGPYLFPGPLVRRLSAEQAWNSILVLSVGADVDKTLLRRGDGMSALSIPGGKITAKDLKEAAERATSAGVLKGASNKKENLQDGYDGLKPEQRFGLLLARASELPQPAPDTHFLRLFGESDRLVADSSSTDGSVPQALMLMNGPVAKLVSDSNCAAVKTAASAGDQAAQLRSLYLSFLSREPNPNEISPAAEAFKSGLTLSDLAWALLNSREFLFIE